jgi:Protein of unknown function (DUF3040)
VPLSEEEQRVLDEIERQLYETDPKLAHEVRTRQATVAASPVATSSDKPTNAATRNAHPAWNHEYAVRVLDGGRRVVDSAGRFPVFCRTRSDRIRGDGGRVDRGRTVGPDEVRRRSCTRRYAVVATPAGSS